MIAYAVCRTVTTPSGRRVTKFIWQAWKDECGTLHVRLGAAREACQRFHTPDARLAGEIRKRLGPEWRVVPVDAATGRVVRGEGGRG